MHKYEDTSAMTNSFRDSESCKGSEFSLDVSLSVISSAYVETPDIPKEGVSITSTMFSDGFFGDGIFAHFERFNILSF